VKLEQIGFMIERVLELEETHEVSMRQVILSCLKTSSHDTQSAILNLCIVLSGKLTAEQFIHDVMSKFPVPPVCDLYYRFSFDFNADFTRRIELIFRFMKDPRTNMSVFRPFESQIVKFISNAIRFASPDFSREAFRPLVGDSRGSLVPRLALETLDPGFLRCTPEVLKQFPVAKFTESEMEAFILSACKVIFRGNKQTINEEVVFQYPYIHNKDPILFNLLHFVDWYSENGSLNKRIACLKNRLQVEGYSIIGDLLLNRREFVLGDLIGTGQFGAVYTCGKDSAMKLIRVAKSGNDRCTFHDVLNEALCQSLCLPNTFCLTLKSCGRTKDGEFFFIESPHYPGGTLRSFRQRSPTIDIIQLLIIFSQILSAVQFLHEEAKVIHYDLKLDNILVDTGGLDNAYVIPRIAIADFGESRIIDETTPFCTRNRGTECIKSPEMISVQQRKPNMAGTNEKSDVWSLGCLFFELLTGEHLFACQPDDDWLQFFSRLTNECTSVLTSTDHDRLGNEPEISKFLGFILVRDPIARPSLSSLIEQFQAFYVSMMHTRLPKEYVLPDSIPGNLQIILPP
jgi:serine/threonine protein kinase